MLICNNSKFIKILWFVFQIDFGNPEYYIHSMGSTFPQPENRVTVAKASLIKCNWHRCATIIQVVNTYDTSRVTVLEKIFVLNEKYKNVMALPYPKCIVVCNGSWTACLWITVRHVTEKGQFKSDQGLNCLPVVHWLTLW